MNVWWLVVRNRVDTCEMMDTACFNVHSHELFSRLCNDNDITYLRWPQKVAFLNFRQNLLLGDTEGIINSTRIQSMDYAGLQSRFNLISEKKNYCQFSPNHILL